MSNDSFKKKEKKRGKKYVTYRVEIKTRQKEGKTRLNLPDTVVNATVPESTTILFGG